MRGRNRILSGLSLPLFGALLVAACTPDGSTSDGVPSEGNVDPGAPPLGGGGPTTPQSPCSATSPATTLFQRSLCVCESFRDVGNLMVKATPGERASVGVNGATFVVNNTDVEGSWASGGTLDATGSLRAEDEVATASDATVMGHVKSGKDLAIGGNLTGAGYVQIGASLRLAGTKGATVITSPFSPPRAAYQAPSAPPCACDPKKALDVADLVRQARTANDNAARGLPTDLARVGYDKILLEPGRYYFTNLTEIGARRVTTRGAVAIFVDGPLRSIGADWLKVPTGSTLDLYVAGAVENIGYVSLGDKANPGGLRVYLGGQTPVKLVTGAEFFRGALYAPTATVEYTGSAIIHGSLLVKNLRGTGHIELTSALPKAPSPESCTSPPPPDKADLPVK